LDSLLAASNSSLKCLGSLIILIPFPPPPREALRMTGYPILFASWRRNSGSYFSPWYPGTIGTLALPIIVLASLFDPMACIDFAGGPINV
jgi:hypothetical protein